MKAAIYYGPGDVRVEKVPDPKAGPYGMVVKVKVCGICPVVDLLAWKKQWNGAGLAMGHEYSGEVVEVGSKVRSLVKEGDRVYAYAYAPCHRCPSCLEGDYWRCQNWMMGLDKHGAMAEYYHVPFVTRQSFVKAPPEVDDHELAMVEPVHLSCFLQVGIPHYCKIFSPAPVGKIRLI